MSIVAIRQCPDYEAPEVRRILADALEAVCDMPDLVRDKDVLIKVNLLSDSPPHKAVCTHPEVVRALIRICRRAGAKEIAVGDMPGMHLTNQPEVAFELSGIGAVCRDEGVRIAPLAARGYREVDVPHFRKLPKVMFAKEILDADVVIDAAKIKTHVQALYTGGIKNWFGAIANRDRKRSHHLTELVPFSESLVDIYRVRPPDLTVLDGVVGMEGAGPNEGRPKQLGLLIASTDCVAADAVAIDCIGFTHFNVPHVHIAAEEGLGVADLDRITIDGPAPAGVRVVFDPPPKAFLSPPKFLTGLVLKIWWVRPRIIAANCQVCGACGRMCPVGAISLDPHTAVIDFDKCIECFCCHESCPHQAIGERMSAGYRLHRWIESRRHHREQQPKSE